MRSWLNDDGNQESAAELARVRPLIPVFSPTTDGRSHHPADQVEWVAAGWSDRQGQLVEGSQDS